MQINFVNAYQLRESWVSTSAVIEQLESCSGAVTVRSDFLSPLSIVMLSRYLKNKPCLTCEIQGNARTYLNTIGFPGGVSSPSRQRETSYLPLTACELSSNSGELGDVTSEYVSFICRKIEGHQRRDIFCALSYLFSELSDNILEHSEAATAWFLAQYYPAKQEVEICIADDGVGFLGTYKKKSRAPVDSHQEALELALGGTSTKGGTDRGFGLRTSRTIIADGLKGEILLASGNCLYFNRLGSIKGLVTVSLEFSGVLFAGKFKIPSQNFDLYQYVEG